jgi:DMSO reductase anchor subunit
MRLAAAAVGGASLIGVVAATAGDRPGPALAAAVLTCVALVAGELCERTSFFEASAPPR